MSDPLRDATSGRQRPFRMDRRTQREDLILGAAIMAVFLGGTAWLGSRNDPKHQRHAEALVRRAGFENAEVTRERFRGCAGLGRKRHAWRTAEAEGYVCLPTYRHPNGTIQVLKRRATPAASPTAPAARP